MPSSLFNLRTSRPARTGRLLWAVGCLTAMVASPRPASAEETTAKSSLSLVPLLGPKLAAGAAYVGSQTCISCHQGKSDTYLQTAHYRTSSVPSAESIHGNFNPGANILRTVNPNIYFVMEANDKGYFQTGVLRRSATNNETLTEPFDIVVGSGRKGQTYLYWRDDALYELPVSYWVEMGEWVSSPGFADGTANFNRPIIPRCLECHASSFEAPSPMRNLYRKKSLMLGIACEKCHGPGGEHVVRYRSASPPTSLAGSAIINPARLSQARQMDICSLCHAGLGKALAPPLSFAPGDTLERYLEFPKLDPNAHIDVHGNQVELLERSRCFRSSPSMTCTTCHDVHTPQRDPAAFVADCLTCHKVESCRNFPKLGHAIDRECITCHMPLQQTTQVVISAANGRTLQPKVRNHQIGIFPDIHLN